MPHASISHPQRGTLEFRQGQADSDQQSAVSNIFPELGTDKPPLVHIETRERQRTIDGRVTAPRRARNDPNTADWRQALANYADRLTAHVSEFQGTGYTFEDDLRSESVNAIYHTAEWTLAPGSPYEFMFTTELEVGQGVFEQRPLQRRNPTVNQTMTVPARVGGYDLPGLREFRTSKTFEHEVSPIINETYTAQNNQVEATEGPTQLWVYSGQHTGTAAQRAQADNDLESLIGEQATLETKWPGYSVDGFVLNYDSTVESRMGETITQFTLRFIEGIPA